MELDLIWDSLTRGLSGFLIRRSQCDTHISCDEGLRRAPENGSFNHEQQELLEANVTRYQFQKDESLQTAFEKLNNSILREFPIAAQQTEKIEVILQAQLLPHLFVNRECSHREVCLHSFEMKLAGSFRKTSQNQMNAGRTRSTI